MPQGSILGPQLFLIYMNDLPDSVEYANITIFVDDTSLFRSLKRIGMELIPAFTKICTWLKANKVSLNTVKTEFMIIGTYQRVEHLDIARGHSSSYNTLCALSTPNTLFQLCFF